MYSNEILFILNFFSCLTRGKHQSIRNIYIEREKSNLFILIHLNARDSLMIKSIKSDSGLLYLIIIKQYRVVSGVNKKSI